MSAETKDTSVAFGFRQVAEAEKQTLVNDVFATVAGRYDQMNDLLSGGLHRLWKDDLVSALNPPRGPRPFQVLDVAGGTGDIAFRIAAASGPGTAVTVADISLPMVREGARRARLQRHDGKVRFSVGNAEALPFASGSFDAYTIAFGIRNVTHIDRALAEAYRVLKPGGRFLCLEFSTADVPGVAELYDLFSFTAVPAIGKVVVGDGAPYRYLVESIRHFPAPDDFAGMIGAAGFGRVSFRRLSFGIVAIHSAWRL